MDREEMMDFIRENLSIEIITETNYEGDNQYVSVGVSLNLVNNVGRTETISECSDTININ